MRTPSPALVETEGRCGPRGGSAQGTPQLASTATEGTGLGALHCFCLGGPEKQDSVAELVEIRPGWGREQFYSWLYPAPEDARLLTPHQVVRIALPGPGVTSAETLPALRRTKAADVLVDELAASTINLRVRFYMNSLRADYLKVGSECMRRVKEAFEKEGISMPTEIYTLAWSPAGEDEQGESGKPPSVPPPPPG